MTTRKLTAQDVDAMTLDAVLEEIFGDCDFIVFDPSGLDESDEPKFVDVNPSWTEPQNNVSKDVDDRFAELFGE